MHRIFLGLAAANLTLLVASFGLGFFGSWRGTELEKTLHGLHFLLGLLTVLATLAVHSIVFTYFLGTGRWVKEVVSVYKMPDWVHAQAVKNKRRAFPFEIGGMALIGVSAWLGAATDAHGYSRLWHLGASALALGFNAGAYVVEYASIVAQARLLLEVKDRADRMRADLAAAGPVAGGPSPGPA